MSGLTTETHTSKRRLFEQHTNPAIRYDHRDLRALRNTTKIKQIMQTKYLVLTMRTPQFNPDVVDAHYAFLDELKQLGQLEYAGPFSDKSGGAYIIRANNLLDAQAIAHRDPVYTSQSSQVTVYEWQLKYAT